MERKISFVGRPISFQPIFVTLTGSHTAAIMLSQMCYWAETKLDGKFWKTIEQWESELLLSRDQQERARKAIMAASKKSPKPWYTESREGVPAKLYHHLDIDVLVETCVFMHRQRPRREPNASLDNLQAQASESHTSMREFPHTRVLETLHTSVSEIPHSITENTTKNTYIDYPPTHHSVVDTAPGTGKSDMEEELKKAHYMKGFEDGQFGYPCEPGRVSEEFREIYHEGYADGKADVEAGFWRAGVPTQHKASTVGVVGGSLSKSIGEERPASRTLAQADEFYDGEASSEEDDYDHNGDDSWYACGYWHGIAAVEPRSEDKFTLAEEYGEYMEGYNAGVRKAMREQARSVAEAVVVNTTPMTRAAAETATPDINRLINPNLGRKGTGAVETPPSPEIAAEMLKYENHTDSAIYAECQYRYAWDTPWMESLHNYYAKAKTNPLRYVRDMCLRRIRQTLEMEAKGLKDEKPKEKLVFPHVANRDPERAKKLAEAEAVDPEKEARAKAVGERLVREAMAKRQRKERGE